MKEEEFMKMTEEKKEKYLYPYAKRCKQCLLIYPKNERYFYYNKQNNPIVCNICKEKNKKKNKKIENKKIEKEKINA